MKRMAADDINIFGKMLLESGDLRSLARSLSTNDGTLFRSFEPLVTHMLWRVSQRRTWPIPRDDLVDRRSFNVVDYVVGGSGDEMAIGKNLE